MAHQHQSTQAAPIVTEESAARRVDWTPGRAVRLTDGESWWLPQIDQALLLVRPDLQTAISRMFKLAGEVGQVEADVRRHAMATAIYHSQLLQLGVVLLRENYDLPDECWLRLASFESADEVFHLTLAVSEALADSILAWLPLHQASGRGGDRSSLLN